MKVFYLLSMLFANGLCYYSQPWTQFAGRVSQFSAKGSELWATTKTNSVLRWNSTTSIWDFVYGAGQYVAAASDGRSWLLRTDLFADNIYRYNNNTGFFDHMPGGLSKLSAADGDNAIGINFYGDIYQWMNNGWNKLPGKAIDVAMGVDKSIFMIDQNFVINQLVLGVWAQFPGGLLATQIEAHDSTRIIMRDVDTSVKVWYVDHWEPYYEPMYNFVVSHFAITQDKVYIRNGGWGNLYVSDFPPGTPPQG